MGLINSPVLYIYDEKWKNRFAYYLDVSFPSRTKNDHLLLCIEICILLSSCLRGNSKVSWHTFDIYKIVINYTIVSRSEHARPSRFVNRLTFSTDAEREIDIITSHASPAIYNWKAAYHKDRYWSQVYIS